MKKLLSCLSSWTSHRVDSFLFEKQAPQTTDHFEHDDGFAIILHLLIYKMEPGELSLISFFFFFFLQSQLLSLLPKKIQINKGEGERFKNGWQETTLFTHLTFIVLVLMYSVNAMLGGRDKKSDEMQSLLSSSFSSNHNGEREWTEGESSPKGCCYCHRPSVRGDSLVLALVTF